MIITEEKGAGRGTHVIPVLDLVIQFLFQTQSLRTKRFASYINAIIDVRGRLKSTLLIT